MAKCNCGATIETFVCGDCLNTHARTLHKLPSLLNEAIVTLTRQDRVTRRIGSRPTERALPFSWAASLILETAAQTLTAWTTEIAQGNPDAHSPPEQILYLINHTDWAAINPQGPQLIDEIRYLANQLRRVIDLPPTRWYAGPCDTCHEALYAVHGAPTIKCPCGAAYNPEIRREWLIEQARDALLPLYVIWSALSALTGTRPRWDVVRKWPDRSGGQRLDQRGTNLSGEALFKVGDVLTRVSLHQERLRR